MIGVAGLDKRIVVVRQMIGIPDYVIDERIDTKIRHLLELYAFDTAAELAQRDLKKWSK